MSESISLRLKRLLKEPSEPSRKKKQRLEHWKALPRYKRSKRRARELAINKARRK